MLERADRRGVAHAGVIRFLTLPYQTITLNKRIIDSWRECAWPAVFSGTTKWLVPGKCGTLHKGNVMIYYVMKHTMINRLGTRREPPVSNETLSCTHTSGALSKTGGSLRVPSLVYLLRLNKIKKTKVVWQGDTAIHNSLDTAYKAVRFKSL